MLSSTVKFIFAFFSLLLGSYAASQELTEVYTLLPVRETRFDPQGVRFNYELPCGAEKIGVLAHREANGTLRLAVVTQLPVRSCMGLGSMESDVLRGMNYADIAQIQTFDQDTILKRIRFPRIEAANHDGKTAQVVYRSACGQPLGILIQDRGEELALGVIEAYADNKAPCERHALMLELSDFNMSQPPLVTPLRLKRTELERLYFLRLATIDATSLQQENQRVSFVFEHACNEAPVGLVQDFQSEHGKNQIAMVIAHYPNQECEAGTKVLRAKYRGSLLTNSPVTLLKDQFDPFVLTLSTPTNLAINQGFMGTQIQLATYNECQRSLGVIIKRNELTDMAVAVLQAREEQPCKSNIKEVSLNQPLMTDLPPRRITFLSLKGE